MRKSKRMIALVLVLVMVLSSITFSSGSSQAEGDSNSGNKIVLNFPESEKNNVDLSNYELLVKNKSDGKDVSDVTSYATATDAEGNKIVITDRKLTNGTTYVAEVTSSNWTGYKYKAEFKYDGKDQNVTLDKYLTMVTIKLDQEYNDIKVSGLSGSDKVSIGTDKVNDNGNEKTISIITVENAAGIKGNSEVAKITATKAVDGVKLACEGSISLGSSEIGNIVLNLTQYIVRTEGVKIPTVLYKKSTEIDDSYYVRLADNTVLDKNISYNIKLVGDNNMVIDSTTGITNISKSMSGKKQVIKGDIDAGESEIVNISASQRAVDARDIASVDFNKLDTVVPEIPFNVTYTVTMKDQLPSDNLLDENGKLVGQVSVTTNNENVTVTRNDNTFTVDGSNISFTDKNTIRLNVMCTFSDTDREKHDFKMATTPTVVVSDVVYGKNGDFYLSADKVESSGTNKYYYRDDKNKATIKFNTKSYTHYRFKTAPSETGSMYGDFKKITESVGEVNADTYTFQMKNDNKGSEKFGVSSAVTLLRDNTAPEISIDANSIKNTYKNEKGIYVVNNYSEIEVIASDPSDEKTNASGIAKIVYSDNELTSDEARADEAPVLGNDKNIVKLLKKSGEYTIYLYAVDNVGNVSKKLEVVMFMDESSPKISSDQISEKAVTDFDAGTYDEVVDGNNTIVKTVYYKKDTKIEIIASDDNISEFTVNVNDEKRNTESGSKYSFNATAETGKVSEYTIVAKASDGVNPITVEYYKVVIDKEMPSVESVDVEPVKVEDKDNIFPNYGETYTALNSESEVSWEYTDSNKSTVKLKINDETQKNEFVINNNGSMDGKYVFEKNINEFYALDKNNISVIFTDKAGNSVTKTISRKDGEKISEANNICYVKNNKFSFGNFDMTDTGVNSTSGHKTLEVDNKKFTGTIYFKKEGEVYSDFLKVYAVKDANDTEKTDITKYATISGNDDENDKKISISVPTGELSGDGDYKFVAYYYDIADGQVDKVESDVYTLDSTAPTILGKQEIKKIGEKYALVYTYTLTEKNPNFGKFTCSVKNNTELTPMSSGKNNTTKKLQPKMQIIVRNKSTEVENGFESLQSALADSKNWVKDGTSDQYTATVKIMTEGIYNMYLQVEDTAGNKANVKENGIIFDKTAPEVTVDVDTKNNPKITVTEEKPIYTDYNVFNNSSVILNLTMLEDVGTISKISWKTDNDGDSKDSKNVHWVNKNKKVTQDKNEFTTQVAISANFKGKITFTVTDSNNNSSTFTYENGIVVEDKNKHNSHVSISKAKELNTKLKDSEYGIYRGDVELELSASDTYSGIKNVTYTVKPDKARGYNVEDGGNNFTSDKKGGIRTSWKNSKVVIGDQSNKVEVWVAVTDNAGNTTLPEKVGTYAIDKTLPVIDSVKYTGIAHNNKYYTSRTATITIDELNFAQERTHVTIQKGNETLDITKNFRNIQGNKWVMSCEFGGNSEYGDGDYSNLTVTTMDQAGNVAKTVVSNDSFTIDNQKPTMTITYDNNNAKSGTYYGEARTATITVNEHNFAPEDITVDARKDGTPISISGWSGSGDTHVATVSFNADGNYTISASCKDRANNQGNSIETQSFTVDLTKPEIAIEGVTNGTSYTGSVLPVVRVTDTNYDEGGVIVTLTGGKNGVRESGYSKSSIANGQAFSFYDLEHAQKMDDCYTLTVKAVDKAGHETTQTISYRVNRFGSIYSLSKALESAVDSYYAVASDKFAIYEQNVDEVKTSTVSYTIDNEIVNLEEGKDYTVKHSEDRTGWNQYEYVLSKDSFAKEGVYTVSVSSEDTVGNISDNKSKGVNMEFCIDNTAPVCIISGVEEGQKIERDASANIGIEAYDNIMFATMKVELNGEQIKSEADLQDGKLSFTVSPTSGEQTLKVTCYDAAGNEKIEEVHFTFDVSILNSHLWIVLVIIAICIVLLGMVIIIVNKRRRANQ